MKTIPRAISALLSATVCAGASAGAVSGRFPASAEDVVSWPQATHEFAGGYSAPDAEGRARYIVILDGEPLASYAGGKKGLARVPRLSSALAAGRPDVKSVEASTYVAHLRTMQQAFVAGVAQQLGRRVPVAAQFQHALNAVVLDLTPDEADRLRRRADVKLVDRERIQKLNTYATPALIGATQIWNGTATPGGVSSKGEGIVIGVIDSGVNWASHSFKAVGADGYAHVNPLGTGNYLGGCRAGGPDAGHCNDKLIGIYNLSDPAVSGQDLVGHGSHTASTAAGAFVTGAPFVTGNFNVSGIAPHANVIVYNVVSDTGIATTSLVGAIEQTVADGIVDVINYSIGAPWPSPWAAADDLAFLGAINAGIFVAKAVGNSGSYEGSASISVAPWETVVGATTSDQLPAITLSLVAPSGTPDTVDIPVRPGNTPLPVQGYDNLPLIESPGFADGGKDGCEAYPANQFRRGRAADGVRGIAALHLDPDVSKCSSAKRRVQAEKAGALAVLFISPDFVNLGASGASYSVRMSNWNAIKATTGIDVTADGNASATLSFPAARLPRTPDLVANFSSRGPIPFAMLKPDLSAPGVDILAATSPGSAGGYNAGNLPATAQAYALASGTSMAAPHVAGAAALVRAVNRSWTPMEVQSALMTTAAPLLSRQDGMPSNPNIGGAGRIDLAKATRAGLLLDETYDRFLAADPVVGGKPETLNLSSFYHHDCIDRCVFKRTVRSSGKAGVWTLAVTGLPAGSVTLDKTSFPLGATGRTTFSLTVDTQNLTKGQWYYGQLTLTSSNADVPVARLPIAIRPATPKLRFDPPTIQARAQAGSSTTRVVTVSNPGNPGLAWSFPGSAMEGTVVRQLGNRFYPLLTIGTVGGGTDILSPHEDNLYGADYFDIAGSGSRIKRLRVSSVYFLDDLATQLAWRVYADNGANQPAGVPGDGVAPIFQYQSAPDAQGLSHPFNPKETAVVTTLDLAAAGVASPSLQAGRYWLSMTPTVPAISPNFSENWYWHRSKVPGKQVPALYVAPNAANPADRAWRSIVQAPDGSPDLTGLAMQVDIDAICGAPWMWYGVSSGVIGSGASMRVTVNFDAAALAPGTYTAYLCLDSNGTSPPNFFSNDTDRMLVPVTFTVDADRVVESGIE